MDLRDRLERLRINAQDRWGRLPPGARKRILVGGAALPVLLAVAVVLNVVRAGPSAAALSNGPVTFESGQNPAFQMDLDRLRAMPVEAVRDELAFRRDTRARMDPGAPADQRAAADAAVQRAEQVLAERGG